jgi:GT2 family glycosyltransferase
LQQIRASVVVPTLAADSTILECLAALERQTLRDFEVIVVDNSGESRVRNLGVSGSRVRVIEPVRNVGFGAAVNAAIRVSEAPYLVALNDDTCPHAEWLAALVETAEGDGGAGMVASKIRLAGTESLDSAGMLLCADGSSKQRGHLAPSGDYPECEEVLLPSACAALYRRDMLAEIGLFDEEFFLYCEDTDLGLRARWAGWKCLYAPGAVVEHRYSRTAGRASPLKAYFVERNRLFLAVKNLPASMLWKVPFVSAARYFWHVVSMFRRKGAAAHFHKGGHSPALLPYFVLRAHVALLARLGALARQRRAIRAQARISPREFRALAGRFSIGAREVAAL